MRLVRLSTAPEGAELGRDVPSNRTDGMPLLRAGAVLTARFKEALVRAGVQAIYIADEATEGIAPQPVLNDETRSAAAAAVAATFAVARDALSTGAPLTAVTLAQPAAVASQLVSEVGRDNDVALALADLSAVDGYILQHSIDVAALGLLIGRRLYQDHGGYVDYRGRRTFDKIEARLSALTLGLMLQDIGKLAIPREVLERDGPLSDNEWALMRRHTIMGADLLRSDSVNLLVRTIVRSHHERWDGSGYPDGKAGEAIHELARIAAVADTYDAITSLRPFAPARPAHAGVRVIREGRGSAFDPAIVDVFCSIIAPFPPGDPIELTDGRTGVVSSVPEDNLDRPVVRVLDDGEPYEVALADDPFLAIRGWEDMEPVVPAGHAATG